MIDYFYVKLGSQAFAYPAENRRITIQRARRILRIETDKLFKVTQYTGQTHQALFLTWLAVVEL